MTARVQRDRPQRPRTLAADVVERGLAAFLVVWAAAFLLPDPLLNPTAIGSAIGVAVIAACVLILGGLVVTLGPRAWRRWISPVALAASLLLAGAGIALVLTSPPSPDSTPAGVAYLDVAVAAAGLRLWTRLAAIVVGIESASLGVVIAVVGGREAAAGATADAALFGLYVLVLAVICMAYAAVLRRTAAAADAADSLLARTLAQRATDETVRRDVAAHERALHDTVLNALAVVARGADGADGQDVRPWCARAADQIEALTRDGAGPPGQPAGGATLRTAAMAAAPGLAVPVRGDDLALDAVPGEVAAALVAATAEVLRNVARHADATGVRVDVRRPQDGAVAVVVRDDGRGFDPATAAPGLGLARSVSGAMNQVGGSAAVTSRPGEGTTVTLEWSPAPSPLAAQHLLDDVGVAVSRVAPTVLLPSAILALLSLIVGWEDYARPGLAIAAYAGFAAVGLLEIVTGRRGHMGWSVAIVAFLAGPVIYRLTEAALATDAGQWSSWASEAVLTILVVVVIAGPSWSWIGALVSWWVTQGLDPFEFIRPGGALLVSSVVLAVAVRAGARAYHRSLAEVTRLSAEAAAGEAERRRRARYAVLTDTTLPLLRGLADGSLDPGEPPVRRRCRDEERFVRTLVRLDPAAGPLPAMLVDLAIDAHLRGLSLEVDLRDDDVAGVSAAAVARAGRALGQVLAGLPPVSGPVDLRLTGGAEGDGVVLRLVSSVPMPADHAPPEGVERFADQDGSMWEVVLPGGDRGAGQ